MHRFTFSKTVADFVVTSCKDADYEVQRFRIKRGRRLEPGEDSATGIYMTCTAGCGSPLRVTLIKGISELHYDEQYRHVYEGQLVRP